VSTTPSCAERTLLTYKTHRQDHVTQLKTAAEKNRQEESYVRRVSEQLDREVALEAGKAYIDVACVSWNLRLFVGVLLRLPAGMQFWMVSFVYGGLRQPIFLYREFSSTVGQETDSKRDQIQNEDERVGGKEDRTSTGALGSC